MIVNIKEANFYQELSQPLKQCVITKQYIIIITPIVIMRIRYRSDGNIYHSDHIAPICGGKIQSRRLYKYCGILPQWTVAVSSSKWTLCNFKTDLTSSQKKLWLPPYTNILICDRIDVVAAFSCKSNFIWYEMVTLQIPRLIEGLITYYVIIFPLF